MGHSVRVWSRWLGIACLTVLSTSAEAVRTPTDDPLAYVNPFIGSGKSGATDPVPLGGGGDTFPGATLPFGMVAWSPDTPGADSFGYIYEAKQIQSFSVTHVNGIGCSGGGEVPLLPTVGAGNRQGLVGYDHAHEQAAPGYYQVQLDNGVNVELTATLRSGLGRFTFPATSDANFVLDGIASATGRYGGELKANGDRELTGSVKAGNFCGSIGNFYTLYYTVQFSRPARAIEVKDNRAFVTFDARKEQTVAVKVGISYVSLDNARLNLSTENPGWDFTAVRAGAEAAWRGVLGRVRVGGGTATQKRKFYTALYHTFMTPNTFSDVNGDYEGFDFQRHHADGYVHYANFSGWDVYRSQVEFLAWIFPQRTSDILQSLVNDADQCGALPKWAEFNTETTVMVGDPGTAIVAAAAAMGATKFDQQKALKYMLHTAFDPTASCQGRTIRPNQNEYQTLGYVPALGAGEWGSAAGTLEYMAADFAASRFAESLGDFAHADQLRARAFGWRKLFNPQTGFIQPRAADGAWLTPFDPTSGNGFVEGNAYQYLWMVPHDAAGLVAAAGGNATAVARLDQLFEKLNSGISQPNFYIGNEPNFTTPWVYLWAQAPHRTQDVVRRILDESYLDATGGLPGNDDLGAISSWFVWGALGLYPAVPGTPGLAVASPLFPSVEIDFDNGKTLRIVGKGAPDRYVQALSLNGVAQTRPWLEVGALAGGGELRFDLVDKPASWGNVAPPTFAADASVTKQILADGALPAVREQALALVTNGLAAGTGYAGVWIRDLNTFLELALEGKAAPQIRGFLARFMELQAADGGIDDNIMLATGAAEKTTTESDQETSLVLAVTKYVDRTGDTAFLKQSLAGETVYAHLARAIGFLYSQRYAAKYGLIWGATRADWGDVQPEDVPGIALNASSHPAITIYDNAMLVLALQAMQHLAPLIDESAAPWREKETVLRARIRQHLWLGDHFKPHLYLDAGSPFPATFDEDAIYYQGGTTLAIAADLLTPEEAQHAFQRMIANKQAAHADSIGVAVFPAYPSGFFKNGILSEPYTYQNGGDWPWFGAKAIQQMVRYGEIGTAYAELLPMLRRVQRDHVFYEWYALDGSAQGSADYRGTAGELAKAIDMLRQALGR